LPHEINLRWGQGVATADFQHLAFSLELALQSEDFGGEGVGGQPEDLLSSVQHPEPEVASPRKRRGKSTWISLSDQKWGFQGILWV
jgi:hypothetical protein